MLKNEMLKNEKLKNKKLKNEKLKNEKLKNEMLKNEMLKNEMLKNEKRRFLVEWASRPLHRPVEWASRPLNSSPDAPSSGRIGRIHCSGINGRDAHSTIGWFIPILLVPLILLQIGCGKEEKTTGPEAKDPIQLTRDGWREFENTNWTSALENFTQAINQGYESADPYSGAGWTIFMMGEALQLAENYWTIGLDKPGGTYDIMVGLGFTADAREDFDTAIMHYENVLDRNANYQFEHRSSINHLDLRWSIAKNFYLEGIYDSSYVWVQQLNGQFILEDPNSDEGKSELSAEIERLGELIRG